PFNREFVIQVFRNRLTTNYYWQAREAQYYSIEKKAFIEGIIDDGFEDGPLDYRFWCFRENVACVQVNNTKHSINPFYDLEWKRMNLSYGTNPKETDIDRPENFPRMLEIAAKLSRDFDFVRVDLYNVRGRIYFGELTFTPSAGEFRFNPIDWDRKFGEMWL